MSRYNLTPETLNTIAALGFDVWWNPDPHWQTYAFFTDGTRIGYIENDRLRGLKLSTVHVPCKECGSGFSLADDFPNGLTLTRDDLEKAFAFAPGWALSRDREAVRKWKDWQTFAASAGRFGRYVLAAKGAEVTSD